jgi:hypothetical protein
MTSESSAPSSATRSLPRGLRILGWIAHPGTFDLAAWQVCNQTGLKWCGWPRTAGFMCPSVSCSLLGLSFLLAVLFLLLAIGTTILRFLRRAPLPTQSWLQVTCLFLCVGVVIHPRGCVEICCD